MRFQIVHTDSRPEAAEANAQNGAAKEGGIRGGITGKGYLVYYITLYHSTDRFAGYNLHLCRKCIPFWFAMLRKRETVQSVSRLFREE